MASSQAEIAYERISGAVVTGELTTGQALSESQLAEFCGVSRTPVREALQRLENDHILVNSDRAWHISDPQPEEIYEIYEAKGILERANAALAAARRTDLDLAVISQIVLRAESASSDQPVTELIAINHEFSAALWRASHNRSLAETLERIGTPHVRFGGRSTLSKPEQWTRAVTYSRDILEALRVRDSERASELALTDVEAVREARLAMWHEKHNG